MQTRKIPLFLGCMALLLLAAGCFQAAGTAPDGLDVAGNTNPTFTPFPTNEPLVITQPVVITATPDLFNPQQIIPTDSFGVGGGEVSTSPAIAQLPTQDPFAAQPPGLDPIYITATFIVQRATQTEAFIQTATAGGPFATATPFAFATATPVPGLITPLPGGDCNHVVVAGDNLFRISLRYGRTINEVAARNGITNINVIVVGTNLAIPGCNSPSPNPNPNPGPGTAYTVQQGDTLFQISLRYNVTVNCIATNNSISNINLIYINQQLNIPANC